MLVVPAIDLKEGRCVRLLQGDAQQETVYSKSPVEVALSFQEKGAQRLHLVDLDGAFQGASKNWSVIEAIEAALSIPIELGGGIRSLADVERVLAAGIDFAVIGTMAVKKPEEFKAALKQFGGERLILGIDARNGKVAVEGWMEATEADDVEFGKHWKEHGLERIIYTDISRDGMLTGPNLEALKRMAQATGLKITASGGVSSKEDILALRKLEALGVDQVIVGKAIYEGKVVLEDVLSL